MDINKKIARDLRKSMDSESHFAKLLLSIEKRKMFKDEIYIVLMVTELDKLLDCNLIDIAIYNKLLSMARADSEMINLVKITIDKLRNKRLKNGCNKENSK